jgi:hypothetical protein
VFVTQLLLPKMSKSSIQKDLVLFGLKRSQLDKKLLKSKYLLLAKEFHPDRTQKDSSKFIEIQQSYKNLLEAIENPNSIQDGTGPAQWHSREYRSKLNPNDYIQYNTGRHHSFNYKEHYRMHYSQEKPHNIYKKMYYREMLEKKKVNFKVGILFLSICVLSQTDLWRSLFL